MRTNLEYSVSAGFHLGEGALDTLEKAGARVLDRQIARKEHLAALAFSELSYEVTTVGGASGEAQSLQFAPTLETRLVRHPGYQGALNIEQGTLLGATGHPSDDAALARETKGRNYVEAVLDREDPPRYREANTAHTLADNLLDRSDKG